MPKSKSFFTNVPFEITLHIQKKIDFVSVKHKTKTYRIPTFQNKENETAFRFASQTPGKYEYIYDDNKDGFFIKKYKGNNPPFKHGAIRMSGNKKYLQHEDGTPFFWLADTWWYGMTKRAKWPNLFKTLTHDRKKKGFSVVQIVVGIPPETEAYSDNAQNSGGTPFKKDWKINPKYFLEVDKKISYLVENNIVPCIVGGWGHHLDLMGEENIKRFWKEIIARYGAYPVVFCLTGEVDIPPINQNARVKQISGFLPKIVKKTIKAAMPHIVNKRLQKWNRVAEYIKITDPFKRLLTVHPHSTKQASKLLDNPEWLDIEAFQSGHTKERKGLMINSILESSQSSRPIINLEPWYEGILGNFWEEDQRYAFWMSLLAGAAGYSYGAHGIWQMSKRGENFLFHWGNSSWQEALHFKGVKQLGLAKKFLQKYQWWKFKPNLARVIPHWSPKETNLPLSAEIDNLHVFIYFPRVQNKQVFTVSGFSINSHYRQTWIDPKLMSKINGQIFKGKIVKITLPNYRKNQDWLLVISKNVNFRLDKVSNIC